MRNLPHIYDRTNVIETNVNNFFPVFACLCGVDTNDYLCIPSILLFGMTGAYCGNSLKKRSINIEHGLPYMHWLTRGQSVAFDTNAITIQVEVVTKLRGSCYIVKPTVDVILDRKIPGPLFTKKTPSYGYRDPHYKPKTVWRPSQVYNGNPYTDKTASS